ncbi:MAG TPA: mucoidy inhibitor MuiA family protein [Actinomycetota bacterium]|nr:mucoidy inhibitor MuiA family protein [Actinomycetota bacterium]
MRVFLFGIASLIPSLALADIDLASRVDRVIVFPDGAIVTRVAQLDLQAGTSTLVLRGLPAAIDPGSFRVQGEGGSPFTIGAIDVRTVPADPAPVSDTDLESKLKQLRAERESLQGRISAVEGKKAVIERYAQASPEKLSNEAKPLEVAQWATAWNAIGEGLAQVNEDLRTLRARTADLEAQISALERARPQPLRPGAPKRDIAIPVDAPAPVTGKLQVSYRIAGAGWAALYDARLETGDSEVKPSLTLVRRAQVAQRTGEDWESVQLSVSTVRVNRGTAAPDLPPLQVSFLEPVMREAPARPSSAPVMPDEFSDLRRQERLAASKPGADQQATEQQAIVEASSFQATFHVLGRVTVPNNGSTKSFVLNERTVTPVLSVRASPVIDETAYLEASFTNDDESPILPGEVALHRDGAYVGRARLNLVATGDAVDLGFGADDKVKVTRVPLARRESEPSWIGQTRSDVREFKTTVRNLHKQPIRITVGERVPFSENAAIAVEVLREITPPTERQVQDRRGVMAWSSDYAPSEQKEIRFGYRLKWPAEREVIFAPKPVGPR